MPMQRAGADRGGGAHVAIVGDRCDAYFPLRFQAFCDTASVMGTSTTASTYMPMTRMKHRSNEPVVS